MHRIPQIVIIAEDDGDDFEIFADILQHIAPIKVIKNAWNGKELMDQLDADPVIPSIIFLDLNMPYKNGLECLREIKSNPAYRNTPVAILTTSTDKRNIQQSFELGAHFYVVKPSSEKLLRESLEKVFRADYSDMAHFPQQLIDLS
jgi:CheY-like chemotaxis protein